jgi:UDP-N-acetyl-2-amino-2-deoxyglucuronate dehydrogenase
VSNESVGEGGDRGGSTAPTFALIGAAGFVAPRHLKAIKDVGGTLVAAVDPRDSVGILDSYFPEAHFFVEFERFDRHLDKMRRRGEGVPYVSVCSPNYLHDAHVRFALRSGADCICEKPLVLNPWNLDGLREIEADTGRRVFTILQLRLHPAIQALKAAVEAEPHRIHDVDMTYITSRGRWYHVSWKGDDEKSGGVATNIGVHFFDMLTHIFGPVTTSIVHVATRQQIAGYLECRSARVRWFLSVDSTDLPLHVPVGRATYRSITIDDEEIEFSEGFTDLHSLSYQAVLNGNGFGIDDVRPSIEVVSRLRSQHAETLRGELHPMARRLL